MGEIFRKVKDELKDKETKIQELQKYINDKKRKFEQSIKKPTNQKQEYQKEIYDLFGTCIPVKVGDLVNELQKKQNNYTVTNLTFVTNIRSEGMVDLDTLTRSSYKPELHINGWVYNNTESRLNKFSLITLLPNFDTIQPNGKCLKEMLNVRYENINQNEEPTYSIAYIPKDEINNIVVNVPYSHIVHTNDTKYGINFFEIIDKCEYDRTPESTQEKEDIEPVIE